MYFPFLKRKTDLMLITFFLLFIIKIDNLVYTLDFFINNKIVVDNKLQCYWLQCYVMLLVLSVKALSV